MPQDNPGTLLLIMLGIAAWLLTMLAAVVYILFA